MTNNLINEINSLYRWVIVLFMIIIAILVFSFVGGRKEITKEEDKRSIIEKVITA